MYLNNFVINLVEFIVAMVGLSLQLYLQRGCLLFKNCALCCEQAMWQLIDFVPAGRVGPPQPFASFCASREQFLVGKGLSSDLRPRYILRYQ